MPANGGSPRSSEVSPAELRAAVEVVTRRPIEAVGANGERAITRAISSARRSSGPRWSSAKKRGAGDGCATWVSSWAITSVCCVTDDGRRREMDHVAGGGGDLVHRAQRPPRRVVGRDQHAVMPGDRLGHRVIRSGERPRLAPLAVRQLGEEPGGDVLATRRVESARSRASPSRRLTRHHRVAPADRRGATSRARTSVRA